MYFNCVFNFLPRFSQWQLSGAFYYFTVGCRRRILALEMLIVVSHLFNLLAGNIWSFPLIVYFFWYSVADIYTSPTQYTHGAAGIIGTQMSVLLLVTFLNINVWWEKHESPVSHCKMYPINICYNNQVGEHSHFIQIIKPNK